MIVAQRIHSVMWDCSVTKTKPCVSNKAKNWMSVPQISSAKTISPVTTCNASSTAH